MGTSRRSTDKLPSRPLWGKPGWMMNPRPPSVPATLHLSLEQYYAACAVIGLLSSQHEEPDQDSAIQWALEFGQKMAKQSKKIGNDK